MSAAQMNVLQSVAVNAAFNAASSASAASSAMASIAAGDTAATGATAATTTTLVVHVVSTVLYKQRMHFSRLSHTHHYILLCLAPPDGLGRNSRRSIHPRGAVLAIQRRRWKLRTHQYLLSDGPNTLKIHIGIDFRGCL
jgi:hypothetical protein